MLKLPANTFADPKRMLYPCHTKAAAFLANAYFQDNRKFYSTKEAQEIQERLDSFINYWAIAGDIKHYNREMDKVASGGPKVSLTDDDYAIVAEIDGKPFRRLPINTPMSIKLAGEYLYKNRHKFTYPMRKQAARKILVKIAALSERLEKGETISGVSDGSLKFEPATADYIEKAAGFGASHPRYVAEKIAQRMLMLGHSNPDYRIKLGELAVIARDMEATPPAFLQKVASVIDEIDRDSGIAEHYDSGVELPEEMLFHVLEKDAAETLSQFITLQTGNTYPVSLFASLPLEKVSSIMGSEFADAVKDTDRGFGVDPIKVAEIAPTLPRDEASLLEKVIGACNIKQAELDKEARKRSGYVFNDDDFSKEAIESYFRNKGYKTKDMNYAMRLKPEIDPKGN